MTEQPLEVFFLLDAQHGEEFGVPHLRVHVWMGLLMFARGGLRIAAVPASISETIDRMLAPGAPVLFTWKRFLGSWQSPLRSASRPSPLAFPPPYEILEPIHSSNIFQQKKRHRGHPLCLPRPLSPGCTAGNCDLTFSTVPLVFPSLFRADMPPICSALFLDDIVKSRKTPFFVIPAKAGIQFFQLVTEFLDSGFHRSDDLSFRASRLRHSSLGYDG